MISQFKVNQSPLWRQIVARADKDGWTSYALWREARIHCPTLSESAVSEFRRGKRALETKYLGALMITLGLDPPLKAVKKLMGRRRINRRGLYLAVKLRCPKMARVALYGFLAGRRSVGLKYLDAIMAALDGWDFPTKVRERQKVIPVSTKPLVMVPPRKLKRARAADRNQLTLWPQ